MPRRSVDRRGNISNRGFKSLYASVPSPVGGLNARDALANMPVTDAVILENWFPTPADLEVRGGHIQYSTGYPDWVETVMTYNSTTASKFFAVSGGSLYDSSSLGAVGAAIITGLSNSRFQNTGFTNAAGSWLYAVNGEDDPLLYNGTSWQQVNTTSSPIAITGVDPSTFISVNSYKERLFFIPKESTSFYYLAVNAVGGAASAFNLGSLLSLGGYLMAMVTWSIDNAGGLQDYAAFISSEGEVLVYQGNDPSDADTWGLVNKFRIGRPIGRRCYEKMGSDVIIICADGFFPLSKALLTDRSQVNLAVSNKIVNLVNNDVATFSGNFGWQILLHPIGQKLLINVPSVENGTQYQYVMNTVTGAWTKFTGWNAACWALFEDNIYFGGNGYVAKADYGQDDDGAEIVCLALPAFSYFGTQTQKKFNMVRPIFYSDGTIKAGIGMCFNFSTNTSLSTPDYAGSSGAPWDLSPWDITPWGGASNNVTDWLGVGGLGFSAALKMQVNSKNLTVKWQSTDYAYEQGGLL